MSPAFVAQLGCVDVVLTVRGNQGDGRETLDDPCSIPWSTITLQQLLQHDSGGMDGVSAIQGISQTLDLGLPVFRVPPQGQ